MKQINVREYRQHDNVMLILLSGLLLFIAGCLAPSIEVIDANDPVEASGNYLVIVEDIIIPNPDPIDGDISATVFIPSQDGSSMASVPTDLLILLPGFSSDHRLYDYYSHHFASHGSLVLSMTPTGDALQLDGQHDKKAQQIINALDYMLVSYQGNIDKNKIGLVGHSLGGKLAFYAASLDTRFRLVMAMDPVNSGGAPCFIAPDYCGSYQVAPNPGRGEIGLLNAIDAPSLILRSAPDSFNPEDEFNASYFYYGSDGNGADAVSSPSLYFDMGSTRHAAYVPGLLSAGSFAPVLTKRTMTAWIKQHFYGQDMQSYLTGSKVEDAISAGWMMGFDER